VTLPEHAFYAGKTVMVTGHTGFKGGWLTAWLKLLGARVIGFSLEPEPDRPSIFEAAHIARDMVSIIGDLRDLATIRAAFAAHAPEIVFHLAAQALVRRSHQHPVETYATNVMGTVHVLEAVRATPSVRTVVIVTSDKCYENREWPWGYREIDPMGGRDPYSSSKGCAELATAAYRSTFFRQHGPHLASARAGNVIGGGDWAQDRLVPDVVRALSVGSPVVIRNPRATRPWQYVLDPLRGYLMLAQRLWEDGDSVAEPWNFGPSGGDAVQVIELVDRLLKCWGTGRFEVKESGDAPPEAHSLELDCRKARARLGWTPAVSLQEGLEMTVEWYRRYHTSPADAPATTTRQIERYMEYM
jgi:CDP-glucose 4,6-dehydratase